MKLPLVDPKCSPGQSLGSLFRSDDGGIVDVVTSLEASSWSHVLVVSCLGLIAGREMWKDLRCWMEVVGRAEMCYLVSPVTKLAEDFDALIESRVSQLFHLGHLVIVRHSSLSLEVLASGSQKAKFIAPSLLGQMKMEVEVLLRVGCVLQTFVVM